MPGSGATERSKMGRGLRTQVPRSRQAEWTRPARRRDPVEIIRGQEATRISSLLPIRHERMAVSAFTYFRGAAAVMAEDLAQTPACGLRVQACGDAHLLNFGIYATPERRLVFDVNDFDETLHAPFEGDVKRLAASLVVAGRDRGFGDEACASAAQSATAAYREQMATAADQAPLDVWYARLDAAKLMAFTEDDDGRELSPGVLRHLHRATNIGALDKLTEVVNGRRRIVDSPPLVEHLPDRGVDAGTVIGDYVTSLGESPRDLLARYHVVDWARKV